MSERDRGQRFIAWGIGLLSLFVLVTTILIWHSYSDIHSKERAKAAENHYRKSIVACEPIVIPSAIDCLIQKDSASYEETAEYYDLKAQQEMSKWALLMLFVTSFGVVFIALTFHASRETLKAAHSTTDVTRRIGNEQLRAFIKVSVQCNLVKDTDPYFEVFLNWTNVGQTIARNVRIKFNQEWSEQQTVHTPKELPTTVESMLPQDSRNLTLGKFAKSESEDTKVRKQSWWVVGSMTYVDVMDEERFTNFSFNADLSQEVTFENFIGGINPGLRFNYTDNGNDVN